MVNKNYWLGNIVYPLLNYLIFENNQQEWASFTCNTSRLLLIAFSEAEIYFKSQTYEWQRPQLISISNIDEYLEDLQLPDPGSLDIVWERKNQYYLK